MTLGKYQEKQQIDTEINSDDWEDIEQRVNNQ